MYMFKGVKATSRKFVSEFAGGSERYRKWTVEKKMSGFRRSLFLIIIDKKSLKG